MEDAIIQLQTIVGHQEAEIANLSKELYKQQKELAILRQHVVDLQDRFRATQEDGATAVDNAPEPPPPHY